MATPKIQINKKILNRTLHHWIYFRVTNLSTFVFPSFKSWSWLYYRFLIHRNTSVLINCRLINNLFNTKLKTTNINSNDFFFLLLISGESLIQSTLAMSSRHRWPLKFFKRGNVIRNDSPLQTLQSLETSFDSCGTPIIWMRIIVSNRRLNKRTSPLYSPLRDEAAEFSKVT